MGRSPLITPEEAGEVLGVGEKQVRRYVRRGWLRPVYDKSRGLHAPLLLSKEEVAALAEALEDKPNLTQVIQRAVQSYVLARSLERRVEQLEQLMGAHYSPLSLDRESVRALYAEARGDVVIPPVDPEKVSFWTRVFMGIGEEFFDALLAYTSNERAWETFHDLSRAIIEEAPLDRMDQEEVRSLYRCYEKARRNLRAVLFFHVRTHFGTPQATRMFRDETNLHERVMGFLNLGQSARANARRSSLPFLGWG